MTGSTGDIPEEKRDEKGITAEISPRRVSQTTQATRSPTWGTLSEQLSDALIGLCPYPGSMGAPTGGCHWSSRHDTRRLKGDSALALNPKAAVQRFR